MSESTHTGGPTEPGIAGGGQGAPGASAVAIEPVVITRERGSLRRILLFNGIALLVVIAVALIGFYVWHQSYYFYSTDDAKVDGTIAAIAPDAPGSITHVYHTVGSTVSSGDTVVTLRAASGQNESVRSPINGTIISEGALPGEVLPAGQPLGQVVDLSRLFITAYVEETHIGDVAVGQGVDVKVDAVKDITFHGTVTRILPATAGTFSLLPTTDYSSGNFTKVTQRVPVQITLDSYQGHSLYPGESAQVTIHIHT